MGVMAYVAIQGYDSSSKQVKNFAVASAGSPTLVQNGVDVLATIVSVKPEDQTAQVRLNFSPVGSYGNPDLGELVKPVSVLVAGHTDEPVFSFAAGQAMSPRTVTVSIDGQVTGYPFDKYSAFLEVIVLSGENNGTDTASARVPSQAGMHSNLGDWAVDVNAVDPGSGNRYVSAFDIKLRRAPASIAYSIFVIVLIWALALASVALVLALLHRPIAADALVYLAALLFAFPVVRTTALPGNPPVGVLVDYFGFFWTELIVAIALVFLGVAWSVRDLRPRSHNGSDTPDGGGHADETAGREATGGTVTDGGRTAEA